MSPISPQMGRACHDATGRGGTAWRVTPEVSPPGSRSGSHVGQGAEVAAGL